MGRPIGGRAYGMRALPLAACADRARVRYCVLALPWCLQEKSFAPATQHTPTRPIPPVLLARVSMAPSNTLRGLTVAVVATHVATTQAGDASSSYGTASWGKEPIKLSATGPENLLPNFAFMAGGEEGV